MEDKDHDLLIRIDAKLDDLELAFSNHLHYHRTLSIALISAGCGLITALIIALV